MELETETRSQHRREWAYQHANTQQPLYVWSRKCSRSDCDVERPQTEMIWLGSSWVCPEHYRQPVPA